MSRAKLLGRAELLVGLLALAARPARAYEPAGACELALDTWCTAHCPHTGAHGRLYARFDTALSGARPAWRCYAKETLSADLQRYERGDVFCTRDAQLKEELAACLNREAGHGLSRPGDSMPPRREGNIPQPPPPLPPAAADGSCAAAEPRFLYFSVAPTEQLNKQRRALLHYMRMARQLGRTLVLPRAHQVRKDKRAWTPAPRRVHAMWYVPDGNEYFPLSLVYNMSTLSEYQPSVELADLWALPSGYGTVGPAAEGSGARKRRIDLLFVAGRTGPGGQACVEGAEQRNFLFNGVQGVVVGDLRCAPQRYTAELQKLAHVRSIGFADAFDQVPEQQAHELVPFLRFVRPIYTAAEEFVQAHFGEEPFLAVHWRRADFKLTRGGRSDVLLEVDAFIERVESALLSRGLSRLYLATDATEEDDLARIRERLDPRRFSWVANADETDMQVAMDVANIEIAICAMAAFFLGTRTSNYSLTVREERRARGHPDETHNFLAFKQDATD
ncbi:GDP-fucose protein O-fucosyltransferase-domain-containing protein [Pavlovales sp. CCMP2436]|nr:GDP-fucose protein O-fucosyltransferase-domain-containing protein [Pavlovales sp. CCMP2436]|mmetsp:Transcript_2669/g.6814  ORF Transcript_2669/g.6814 Transcript_2669/m.6814 type:complete len:503 (+) Transcript_2669:59-1567(+)